MVEVVGRERIEKVIDGQTDWDEEEIGWEGTVGEESFR